MKRGYNRFDAWKTFAWCLTITRIFLLIGILYTISIQELSQAFFLLLFFVVADFFDGRIILLSKQAAKKDILQRHDFDAVLDRASVFAVLVAGWWFQLFPGSLLITLVSLEAILITICLKAYFAGSLRDQVYLSGRLASIFLALIAGSFMLDIPSWLLVGYPGYIICRLVSIWSYYRLLAKAEK